MRQMSPSSKKMAIQNTKQTTKKCMSVSSGHILINCLDVFNLQSSGKDWSLGVSNYEFCSLTNKNVAVSMVLVYCMYGPMRAIAKWVPVELSTSILGELR